MSEGLKLLSRIVSDGDTSKLRELERQWLLGNELDVHESVLRHFQRHNAIPTYESVEADTGVNLPSCPEPFSYYAHRVQTRYLFSLLRPEFNSLRDAMSSRDMEEVTDVISRMNAAARIQTGDNSVYDVQTIGRRVMEQYRANHLSPGLTGVTTGYPTLDEQTGGWQRGDLIVWVARPSVGKTYILVNSAHKAWLSGKRILFCSMEMTLEQIGFRYYAIAAGIDPDLFRKGLLDTATERRVEAYIEDMVNDGRFYLYGGNFKGKTTGDIETLISEINPDCVYIDGMYLMSPEGAPKGVGRIEKVGYVADDLKRIAISRNVPLVCTSQFNRTSGKGGAGGSLESIGYSDALSTHASIALAIKFPDGEESDDPSFRPNRRKIETMKGREGECGFFYTNFVFAPVNFDEYIDPYETDITPPDVEPDGEIYEHWQVTGGDA